MSEADTGRMSTIPKWDGRAETCPRYLSQLGALAEYHDCGNAMDETEMNNCPTRTQYVAISDKTVTPGLEQATLYKANKRICAIITLGQGSDHGLAMMEKTKSPDFPQGLAWKFVNAAMKKNKPNDTTAEMELDAALDKLQFRQAGTFYNDVVSVCARFDIHKSETDLIKLLAKKQLSASYAKMVLDHLKGTTHDLDTLCTEIGEIQRLTKQVHESKSNGNNNQKSAKEKETVLASAEGEEKFRGVCGNCKKKCGYRNKTCPHPKAKTGGSKKCNNCGMNGHVEADCWKKNPEKAPQWYKDMKSGNEGAGTSIDIMLASVEVDSRQNIASSIEAEMMALQNQEVESHLIYRMYHQLSWDVVMGELRSEVEQDFAHARL